MGRQASERHDPTGGAWAPLRQPVFRALWLAAMAANVGFWMQNVGAVWLMGTQTDSALLVSLVQTAMSLPIVFMALPAGAMADVLDLRRMLLGTQTWMLGAAAVLAALTLVDRSPPWVLLTLTFLLGLGRAANAPAWQAVIPEIVEPPQLSSAVALNSVQFNVGRAVGPAVGGLIVAAAGPEAVFALNSVSFLGVVLVLYRWRRQPEETINAGERIVGAVGAGLRYLRNAPALQAVLIRTGLFIVPASALWALLPVVARAQLGMNASGFGVLLACLGAGAVAGVAVLPRIRERFHLDQRLAAGCALFTVALVVLGTVHHSVLVGVAMVGGGVAWTGVLTNLNVATRINVPRWVQGRALAVYLLVFQGGLALGSLAWGLTADGFGAPTAVLAAGIVLAVGTVVGTRWPLRSAGSADLRPSVRPEPEITTEPHAEDGPVLVLVEYRIDPDTADAFNKAMRALARIRRRDGAVRWGVFGDVADTSRYVETYVVPSWAEHLRQHERFTVADLATRDRVRSFHVDDDPPRVSHFIHPTAALRSGRRRRERLTQRTPPTAQGEPDPDPP